METLKIQWKTETVGELTIERQGLYTRCCASCRLPDQRLWTVWLLGEEGELRIGVPEPQGERAAICRSFSDLYMAPLGALRSAQLRLAGKEAETTGQWKPLNRPEDWFRTPWLCSQLKGLEDVRIQQKGDVRLVAIPFDTQKPFPLTQLFCLAELRRLGESLRICYAFDKAERPIMPRKANQ